MKRWARLHETIFACVEARPVYVRAYNDYTPRFSGDACAALEVTLGSNSVCRNINCPSEARQLHFDAALMEGGWMQRLGDRK